MKKLILALFMAFVANGLNAHESSLLEQQTKVYICTGSSATTYHSIKNCRGLSACKSSVKEITLDQAVAMKRKPCKICCK